MFTSRNIITLVLIIGIGALGWVGGSRFPHQNEESGPHGQAAHFAVQSAAPATHGDKDEHAGHGQTEERDAHAGHGHGERPAAGEICVEHRMPEAEDVLCNPQLMATLLPGEGVKMRLATPEAAERAGITLAAAESTHMATGTSAPAQVTYNRSRLAEVMALSGGVLRRIAAEPGQSVSRGTLLAEIASPGAAVTRSEYQAALGRLALAEATTRREQELVAKGVSARMELEQAQAEQQAAEAAAEQLREQLAAFGAAAGGGTRVTLSSPLTGTVVARHAAVGQTLAPETPLFTVADLSSMWLELQLSADQAAKTTVGAAIEAEIDGLPGRRFPGKIIQVAAGLDDRTRLLRMVAETVNPEGLLKAGMFGQAHLLVSEAIDLDATGHHSGGGHGHNTTVAVPAAAVQAIDGKPYVFVALEKDLFELRRVDTGPRRGGEVLITSGLNAGEKVAASQGFALKSELLKSRLGASCADH